MDIQLGRSRTVRRAYGIDEIALVPGGRTVDPAVTDSSWTLGGVTREIPIIASAMDGVVDVGMCVELTKQGALGVLNLEGVQCRYDDPNPALDRIAAVGKCRFDVEVCGGIFVNEPCVEDGNLVSGRTFHDHGKYMGAWMRLLEQERRRIAAAP